MHRTQPGPASVQAAHTQQNGPGRQCNPGRWLTAAAQWHTHTPCKPGSRLAGRHSPPAPHLELLTQGCRLATAVRARCVCPGGQSRQILLSCRQLGPRCAHLRLLRGQRLGQRVLQAPRLRLARRPKVSEPSLMLPLLADQCLIMLLPQVGQ